MSTPPRNASAEHDRFDRALDEAADRIGVPTTAAQRSAMGHHFALMVEANRRFNLTRITTPVEAAIKHYADSLTLLTCPDIAAAAPITLLDVGTGAGFPAIPLAIVCPAWQVAAIDGTGKKARFVAESAAGLGLGNLTAEHVRAADLARRAPLTFDLVVLRAVARIADGLKQVHRLIKPGGAVVFYKSATLTDDESRRGGQTARQLGLSKADVSTVTLPATPEAITRKLVRYRRPPTPHPG